MRNAFASEITDIARYNRRVILLSGDIGNRLFDSFKSYNNDQFFNCGIAEANMMGLASGMAHCGLRPVVYTIAPFLTARCYEQIKIDVCYHNVPVIIVGVGGGLSYSELGATHHSCDDIALMRLLPNMTVICPADVYEVRSALREALRQNGPVYIRLGKRGEPLVHDQSPNFILGKGIIVRRGNDVCLLGTGNILPSVVEASLKLNECGISAQVVSLHTIKPLDTDLLADVFSRFRVVAFIEEHGLLGGGSSSIAEWLVDLPPQKGKFVRIGVADKFFYEAGRQNYARAYFGLTAEKIAEKVMKEI